MAVCEGIIEQYYSCHQYGFLVDCTWGQLWLAATSTCACMHVHPNQWCVVAHTTVCGHQVNQKTRPMIVHILWRRCRMTMINGSLERPDSALSIDVKSLGGFLVILDPMERGNQL